MVSTSTRHASALRDRVGVRLAGFAVTLAVVFAAAYGVGRAIEPLDGPTTPPPSTQGADGHGGGPEHRS